VENITGEENRLDRLVELNVRSRSTTSREQLSFSGVGKRKETRLRWLGIWIERWDHQTSFEMKAGRGDPLYKYKKL
jgi:hypothetical protein